MHPDRITLGPLALADTVVWVDMDDPGFAAIASWSFTDLVVNSDTAGNSKGPVIRFDVRGPTTPGGNWGIWRDGEPCETAMIEGYVLFHLQWEFNRIVLERRTATVHAACVELSGRAFILCGASRSGKTTFAGWLSSQGAGYVADEIVTVTADLKALHYRRPLGLRYDGPLDSLFNHPPQIDRRFDSYEMLVPVSSLGATSMPEDPLPVGGLVFPRVEPGVPSSISAVAKSEAFERLCHNAPGIGRHGRHVFQRLAGLVRSIPTVELVTTDLPEARRLLMALADESVVPA